MTAELWLSEVKRTLNISKSLWTTLEIPTKFLHLNQFENSPILPFDTVSGLHVISLSWCVVLNVFLYLFNNHGFVQNLWYAQLFALCSLFFMSSSISNHLMTPHAILTSNSLRHQHHLLVLPVCTTDKPYEGEGVQLFYNKVFHRVRSENVPQVPNVINLIHV